jgi:hypothetical protein
MIFFWVKQQAFSTISEPETGCIKRNMKLGTLVALHITVKLISKGGWARGSAIFIL